MNRMMLFLAIVWALPPGAAQKVRVDLCHKCNFSQYRTYQWDVPPESQAVNQLMQQRVCGFVNEALTARGLKRVDKGGDLVVSFQTSVSRQDNFTTFTDGWGPGWGWGWGWGSGVAYTTVQPVFIGTLTVNVADARKQQLIFQGVSTSTMRSKPERNTKKFAAGVRKMFEKYP